VKIVTWIFWIDRSIPWNGWVDERAWCVLVEIYGQVDSNFGAASRPNVGGQCPIQSRLTNRTRSTCGERVRKASVRIRNFFRQKEAVT